MEKNRGSRMTEKKAIEVLKNNFPKTCKMVNGRKKGGFDDTDCDFGKALLLAISSLEEIQQYRAIGTVEEIEGLNFNRNQLRLVNLVEEYKGRLGEYEEIGTPNEIRAKLCFLTTYKRADSDGRLVFILDKNGYCEELGGLHIDEIKKRCLGSED